MAEVAGKAVSTACRVACCQATNVWSGGSCAPAAQTIISDIVPVITAAAQLLNAINALRGKRNDLKGIYDKVDAAWGGARAATSAVKAFSELDDSLCKLGKQAEVLQKQMDKVGKLVLKAMMSLLKTLGISNPTVAALASTVFGQPAAQATAVGTVMQIVKWLMDIKSLIEAITGVVKAVHQATDEVSAMTNNVGTALNGGVPLVPPTAYPALATDPYLAAQPQYTAQQQYAQQLAAAGQLPYSGQPYYGGQPYTGLPTQMPGGLPGQPASQFPTVSSGWIEQNPNGTGGTAGGGSGSGDRAVITIEADGDVRFDLPADAMKKDFTIDVTGTTADGKQIKGHLENDVA
jgi:hypothetical protein